MSERLREHDPYTPKWFEARDHFARNDPDGYRRWVDEERHRDRHASAAGYVGWLDEHWTPFWERFRHVSNRYPRCVTEAYDGDLDRAMGDSDDQVAAAVAAWEQAHGYKLVDWHAIGAHERAASDQHDSR